MECQGLRLLPGVTTLKCEPPECHQEDLHKVRAPAPRGLTLLQERNPTDEATVPEFTSARSQVSRVPLSWDLQWQPLCPRT